MQPFVRKFKTLLPAARAEIAKLQALLKQLDRIDRLVQKGKLDEKALKAFYEALPRSLLITRRGFKRANERDLMPMPKTMRILEEWNHVVKDPSRTRPGSR